MFNPLLLHPTLTHSPSSRLAENAYPAGATPAEEAGVFTRWLNFDMPVHTSLVKLMQNALENWGFLF
jgi:hypothetical protein